MLTRVTKNEKRGHVHDRIRKKMQGTAERPRLNVYRSLNHIYVQVIDDHGDRLTGSDTRQHVESRQADQEGLGRTFFPDSESRQQRAALRRRQGVRRSQDGAYQLMESGERQLGFGFDAGRP